MERQPLIVAHRGSAHGVPENTLPAFERAIELGADGIECDVRLTADGHPVIVHDERLLRVADTDRLVGCTNLADLRSIRLRSGALTAENTVIPTLEEVLDLVAPLDVQLIIEIKRQPGRHALAARVVGDTVARFSCARRPILSTSSPAVLRSLARTHPGMQRAYIITRTLFPFVQSWVFAKLWHLSGVHINMRGVSESFARRSDSLHIHRYAWTVNDAHGVEQMIHFGLDGIMTDDVAMALRIREETLHDTRMSGAARG